ncbi:hypothetical protein GWK47_054901 [Chionoecetes opilio]|uniref:Uncharacterized protein n=1 Tax=Chionoecetes opilio TaxID=41210 RepID=A0A8J4XZF1_CHIOP|nr:hypothetical protein GWK47_054901 [Chionoecetes opilio]
MPDDENLPTTATVPTQLVFSVSSASTQDNTPARLAHPAGIPALDRGHFSQEANAMPPTTPLIHTSATPYRPRSPTPQRRQQRFRSRNSGLCWYHNYFGSKASKCDPPCSYAASNEKGEY